ncbi:thiamine transporter 1-like [Thrips palmi]|uniref:Thiamine transporter 1-like n=1 Tax=Thrips palmi TaxID=161013 RepID=A0A6P8ZSS4_THRPL|nr:thiamine transporter 1-like [Thrips palmi]
MPDSYALWCLCILGLLKEFRPSESFLTQYLVSPWQNYTKEEVNQEIYPVGTYSTLILLIIVFLITDLLRYKPVIIVHSLAGAICYCLIIFGPSKTYVQGAEVFYGLFMASEIAYSTYMYASCQKEAYQKVTSYTRIALQAGRLLSGCLSQLLISCDILNFHELNYLSLAGLLSSAVFGCLLPSVRKSVYFHRVTLEKERDPTSHAQFNCEDAALSAGEGEENFEGIKPSPPEESIRDNDMQCVELEQLSGFNRIWDDFVHAFSNMYIVKWSIWWALTQCGYLQVTSYMQNLWQDTADVSNGQLYNGAASATYTILGILSSWVVSQLEYEFDERKTHWLLCICASLSGALIIFSSLSFSLLFQYTAYGAFKILFQVMMIFANTEVATSLSRDSHGLVFGFNTFVALVLQTVLTVIVTGKGGLQLSTRTQFFVYGSYYILIGCGFLVMALLTSLKKHLHSREQQKCDATKAEEA